MREERRFQQVLVTANPGNNLEATWEVGGCSRPVTGSQCCGPPGSLGSVLLERCSVCPAEMQGSRALLPLLSMPKERLWLVSMGMSWILGTTVTRHADRKTTRPWEPSKKIWSSIKNKLFLHIEEQLYQGMWLVFIAKMCHEHLNFVTTKGHHLAHECLFHTNHYQWLYSTMSLPTWAGSGTDVQFALRTPDKVRNWHLPSREIIL